LKSPGYSLQANRKTFEGSSHPDRNAQFEYINEKTKGQLAAGNPAVSVDTKKKELVAQTVIHALEQMPISWVKTITFDNGSEFAGHETMAEALPASIHFAATCPKVHPSET
jgi:hypothetical protein